MKRFECPGLGFRNVGEFVWGGEPAQPDAPWDDRRPPASLWLRPNVAGPVREWWFHVPTSTWYVIERDTRTDEPIGPARLP
jgi:sarcosine oxidase subunit delta